MRKEIVDRLESAIAPLPLVTDGFVSGDYAKAVSISPSAARERLRKLADEGIVRRVRVKRAGGIQQGWQLVKGK